MPPLSRDDRIVALAAAADRWTDPDAPERQAAVEATLEAPNAFTAEALAFAIDQQMAELTEAKLTQWLAGRDAPHPCAVGVLTAGNVPLAGLQDLVAVCLAGHAYLGSTSSKSPALLPAFAATLADAEPRLSVRFAEATAVIAEADALIATGTDETRAAVEERWRAGGGDPSRALLRGHRVSVAVLDGQETEDERDGLAEDTLLHEGFGCRNVALIWAPEGLDPDPYFAAMASFRAVFPAHDSTPGRLTMQQALLEATDQPHAFAEGLSFLLSKGAPEVQPPGHIRWAEYRAISEVAAWLEDHRSHLQLVVARDGLQQRLGGVPVPVVAPGAAQRPALDWCPDDADTLVFLLGL